MPQRCLRGAVSTATSVTTQLLKGTGTCLLCCPCGQLSWTCTTPCHRCQQIWLRAVTACNISGLPVQEPRVLVVGGERDPEQQENAALAANVLGAGAQQDATACPLADISLLEVDSHCWLPVCITGGHPAALNCILACIG